MKFLNNLKNFYSNKSCSNILKKVIEIRGGEYLSTYSSKTQTTIQEEITKYYQNKLNDISRLNVANIKSKEKFISGNRPDRNLKYKIWNLPKIIYNTIFEKLIIIDNKKGAYNKAKDMLEERQKRLEKEEFLRDNENVLNKKRKPNPLVVRDPLLLTYKEKFERLLLINPKIERLLKLMSIFLYLALLCFYLRVFLFIIIEEYKRIYIKYKNKKYKDSIILIVKALIEFLLFSLAFSITLAFGLNTIKSILLKLCYFIYIFVTYIKHNIEYPFINTINYIIQNVIDLYYLLLYLKKLALWLGRKSIDQLITLLTTTKIGYTINHPLINNFLIKLHSYFLDTNLEKEVNYRTGIALNTAYAHKEELRSLTKLNTLFEDFKNYCYINNIKDDLVDYVLDENNKVEPITIPDFDYREPYLVKLHKLLCEIYNIKKTYGIFDSKDLKTKVFSHFKDFMPLTFLSQLYFDWAQSDLDNPAVFKKCMNSLYESRDCFYKGISGKFPNCYKTYVGVASFYGINFKELRKLISIRLLENVSYYEEVCKAISILLLYDKLYNFILYTGFIFSSYILVDFVKQKIPRKIKNYFIKIIEIIKRCISNIKQYIYEFFKNNSVIYTGSLTFLVVFQFLRYILFY